MNNPDEPVTRTIVPSSAARSAADRRQGDRDARDPRAAETSQCESAPNVRLGRALQTHEVVQRLLRTSSFIRRPPQALAKSWLAARAGSAGVVPASCPPSNQRRVHSILRRAQTRYPFGCVATSIPTGNPWCAFARTGPTAHQKRESIGDCPNRNARLRDVLAGYPCQRRTVRGDSRCRVLTYKIAVRKAQCRTVASDETGSDRYS
jgi:hypothetical protein